VLVLPRAAAAQSILPAQHWSRSLYRNYVLRDSGPIVRAARSWPLARREFSILEADSSTNRVELDVHAGFESRAGQLRAGTTVRSQAGGYTYPGPRPYPDRSTALFTANGANTVAPGLDTGFDVAWNEEGASLRALDVGIRFRSVDAWIGRRPIGFSSGPGDGLVLNDRVPFTGAGASIRNGIRLPLVGLTYADAAVARMHRSGDVGHPWFFALRFTLVPSENIVVGLNRAAIFGGDDDSAITARRVALMLLGLTDVAGKDSDFENQVASIDWLARMRIRHLPFVLHGEFAVDDFGLALVHVPAWRVGLEVPSLSRNSALGAGIELVNIPEACCGYPVWYRHGALADGWSDRGRLLGHRLGGAGRELALTLDWLHSVADPLISLRAYNRHRFAENLLAPNRAGRSTGATLSVMIPWRRFALELEADGENGSGWEAGGLRVLGAYRIGVR
jgi:hypothetical protein